jgi:uncharacterized protein YndB with AHSA1/START domain
MNKEPVSVEMRYGVPSKTVWKALTDNNEMKKWYFQFEDFRTEVGFEFHFYGGTEEKQYLHLCKVTEVITGKKIAYSWRYDGYAGISFVTFDLSEEAGQTILRLTHEGLESFPADDPNFAKSSFEAGWNHILGVNLKEHLKSMMQ